MHFAQALPVVTPAGEALFLQLKSTQKAALALFALRVPGHCK